MIRSRAAWVWALAAVLACRSGAPPAAPGPPPGPALAASAPSTAGTAARGPRHRVILISLDGAGSATLHELYQHGDLGGGGFARFFREGEVAEAMVPVNPSLTAVNHISLATGFPPAATGIVGNDFHPPGPDLTHTVSGFDAPIGTETLWEAARRQGRRVGVLAWPGADTGDERRTADWGLLYGPPYTAPQVVDLTGDDWVPPPVTAGAAAGAAQMRRTAARPACILPFGSLDDGPPELALEILAAATAAPNAAPNGTAAAAGFDAVEVTGLPRHLAATASTPAAPHTPAAPAAPSAADTSGVASGPTRVGAWTRASWPWEQPDGPAAAWIKLLALAPDLSTGRLYIGSQYHTTAYPAAFAGALAAAGLAWPGGPDSGNLQALWKGKPGIDLATWSEQTERLTTFMGATLRLAVARDDWDLLMAYVSVIDDAGHRLLLADPRQEGFSPSKRDELAGARRRVWQEVDRELARLLGQLDLAHTTVVVVSDHGMTPVHTAVDPNAPLAALGVLFKRAGQGGPAASQAPGQASPGQAPPPSAPGPRAYAVPNGAMAHVYIDAAGDEAAAGRLLRELAERYSAWRVNGEAPIERVLTRREAASLGLDNPASGDLILFARRGYIFRGLAKGKESGPSPAYGAHGYLATDPAMQASFLAIGAGVTPHLGGTLPATAVAPRVARWLGIEPPRREPPPPAGAAVK